MIEQTVSVIVDRPVEEVFDYATDVDRLPAWNGPLKAARLTSDPPVDAGATYEVDVQMPLGLTQTVRAEFTEFKRPRKATFETRSGLAYRSIRAFEPVGDGRTTISETLQAAPNPLMRLIVGPMIGAFARTQQENLRTLKSLMEADHSP